MVFQVVAGTLTLEAGIGQAMTMLKGLALVSNEAGYFGKYLVACKFSAVTEGRYPAKPYMNSRETGKLILALEGVH
jgi:hypothetical protein